MRLGRCLSGDLLPMQQLRPGAMGQDPDQMYMPFANGQVANCCCSLQVMNLPITNPIAQVAASSAKALPE